MKDSKVTPVVVRLCGSVTLYRIAENLKEGLMMERRVPGLWLGTSTTDELVIGPEKWQGGEEKDCATEVS